MYLEKYGATAPIAAAIVQVKNVQKKTILMVLVVIVAYQNVRERFTKNVLGKESKLGLVYLNFQNITSKKEDG